MPFPPFTRESVEKEIHPIPGQKVMLDSDLAALYGVPTKQLNQAVKRNLGRFPEDFIFRLTAEEEDSLSSQIVTSKVPGNQKGRRGGRRYASSAFTEQGVAMLSRVLPSERAIQVNIEIVRAFVRLRRMLSAHSELARRLDELEERYDGQFRVVFDAIRQLMAPPDPAGRKIGFQRNARRPLALLGRCKRVRLVIHWIHTVSPEEGAP